MPKYVIHVGPPKTGSKYIQSSLAALSDQLRNVGVYYPTDLFSPKPQIWHAPLDVRLRAGADPALRTIFNELNSSNFDAIVFSFEGFYALTEEQLEYWRALMGKSDVEFVYYTRRWSDRIPSLWKQNVKEGFYETFPEMYIRALSNLSTAPDLNNRLVWDKFARIFGRESLKLVSFDNLVEKNVDFVEHFLHCFLGVKLPAIAESLAGGDIIMNHSPDTVDTEILRALNAIHFRRRGETSDAVRVRYLRSTQLPGMDLLAAAVEPDIGQILINDNAPIFKLVHEQLNEYKDCIVSQEYGRQFFTPKASQFGFVRQNYLLDPQVPTTLDKLYDQVMG